MSHVLLASLLRPTSEAPMLAADPDLIPQPAARPILTAEDLVPILGLPSKHAAYRAMRSGDLPVVRIGRRVFVSTAGLRSLLGLPDGASA